MTRLGTGDRHEAELEGGISEAKFLGRELFATSLIAHGEEAFSDLCDLLGNSIDRVLEANGDRETLGALLADSGCTDEWPPDEWPPYGEGFAGWPPPIPAGTLEKPWPEAVRAIQTTDFCWRFHGWVLRIMLQDALDKWSREKFLDKSPWVASHLLARMVRPRLPPWADKGSEASAVARVVFPSLGVLVPVPDPLAEHLGPFRSWDPTQERWASWRDDVHDELRGNLTKDERRSALSEYKEMVEVEAGRRSLVPIRDRRHLLRDLKALVRFQVLGEQPRILVAGFKGKDPIGAARKAIRRTAALVGLDHRPIP